MAKDKKSGYMSPPRPINFEVPEINPDDFELPRRSRRELPEVDVRPIGMPGRKSAQQMPTEQSSRIFRAAQRNYASSPPAKPPSAKPPSAKMPPPPPQIRPGEMSQRRKMPQRPPQKGRKYTGRQQPSLWHRFTGIRINTKYLSFATGGIAAVASIIIAVWFVTNLFTYNALEVYLDGEHVGFIPMNEELTSDEFHRYAVLSLQATLGGASVSVEQQVTVAPARVSNRDITPRNDMLTLLGRRFDYQIAAIAIYVNGNRAALMRRQADLNHVEYLLTRMWFNENTVGAEFVSGWETVVVYVNPDEVEFDSPDDAFWRLDIEVLQNVPHIVESGENLSILAIRYGTSVDRIMLINGMSTTDIWVNDRLYIEMRRPLLSVRTFDEFRTTEIIDMPVETRYNANLPYAHTNEIQRGQNGEHVITLRITRINGVEQYRETLNPEIITEPQTHIIEIGTGAPAVDLR
ncbi:MAG: G5 domain-containing protein [Defluviitaleaceae bacterium]|nr:G5 domain-containing protein [Defluviitaleaceae bacterium]